MHNTDKKRLKKILLNPKDFLYRIDEDDWIVFKKKEEIQNLTDNEIFRSKPYYLSNLIDFTIYILKELKLDSLKTK